MTVVEGEGVLFDDIEGTTRVQKASCKWNANAHARHNDIRAGCVHCMVNHGCCGS